MLHLEDSFIFLFLNSCIAPTGEIITNLSILHMVLFLFGVLRYGSLRDAAVGGVEQGGVSAEVVGCSVLSKHQLRVLQRPAQMDINSLLVLV